MSIADLSSAAYLHTHLVDRAVGTFSAGASLAKTGVASLFMACVAVSAWVVTGLIDAFGDVPTARLAVTVVVGLVAYCAAHVSFRTEELEMATRVLRGQR